LLAWYTASFHDGAGHPGLGVWRYRAARLQTEHIGELIANLLDHSPSPAAALAHALATAQMAIKISAAERQAQVR